MSKKKATMSLKDFHGGSIPSDLPLPSAPGVMVRPSDRTGFDRQTSWGNPMGRSDQRLRPGSAGTPRPFDDKTPFLSSNVRIGRNFEEDERKPLDGVSGPHRIIGNEAIHALPSRMEPRVDFSGGGRAPSRPASSPGIQYSVGLPAVETNLLGVHSHNVGSGSSYSALEVNRMGANHHLHSNTGVSSSGINAWGLKKETDGVHDQVKTSWHAADAASKLAHASALEKVSTGRWHMKQSLYNQSDVGGIGYPESGREFQFMGNNTYCRSDHNAIDGDVSRAYDDVKLERIIERSLSVDDGSQGASNEPRGKILSAAPDQIQHTHNTVKFGGSELISPVLSESTERPKLNLLPRSKPLDDIETPTGCKQVHQQKNDFGVVDNGNESQRIAAVPVVASCDSVNQAMERPKLNLKPRSQPLEKFDGNTEKERSMLFGGARPREVVLKERGTYGVKNSEPSEPSNRIKQEAPKADLGSLCAPLTHYDGKTEIIPLDHGVQKKTDRRDHPVSVEKTGMQKRNWRTDNRRNGRDFEKQQHAHHQQERLPSPETWRKPVQPEKISANAPAVRYGKAASAVDLALAFSRSTSDLNTSEPLSVQRGLPSHDGAPFSRLTGSTTNPRPRINGF